MKYSFVLVLILAVIIGNAHAAEVVQHDLTVRILPENASLEVTDRLRLPTERSEAVFLLGDFLQVSAEDAEVERLDVATSPGFHAYRLRVAAPGQVATLRYRGRVDFADSERGHGGMPLAVLDDSGAYLDGASGWYPQVSDTLQTLALCVQAPVGWEVVGQGERAQEGTSVCWREAQPQDDIYLIAGRFTRYAQPAGDHLAEVYLLQSDAQLAERYLDAIGEYLLRYETMLGPYPYAKFAVVENRWQTGYGMPSFTLLGSRVIRLPFILHSSLPHEILHNWWGNSVFVDYRNGNWSEGLTAYLADHLIKEQAGQGPSYRRGALQRYANYVSEQEDFPLRQFRARHGETSQAVGYSKSLMLFHMLRQQLGDQIFLEGLRRLYRHGRFREVGFRDVLRAFEAVSGQDLETFHEQWVVRAGAPDLRLAEARVEPAADAFDLNLRIEQRHTEAPYSMRVPVAVTLAGKAQAELHLVELQQRDTPISLRFEQAPLRVDLDPQFDSFRRLVPGEVPHSLSSLFGAEQQLLVLPTAAEEVERAAWQQLAAAWQRRFGNVRVIADRDLDKLPQAAAVWVLGGDNRLRPAAQARVESEAQVLRPEGVVVADQLYPQAEFASVLVSGDPLRPAVGYIVAPDAPAIAALARKLPHYGRYGRLLFAAPDTENVLREELATTQSPLSQQLGQASVPLQLPRRQTLDGIE